MASSGEDSKPHMSSNRHLSISSSASAGADSQDDDSSNLKTEIYPGNAALTEEEAIDEHDDESEEERPNRFAGPDSTWRLYTENERGLAASLDQQRANDLSIHLYNAHALLARVRDPEAFANAKPYHSKRRWIKTNEDGSLLWHPEAAWTAWPLKPEDVPRRREQFGVDAKDVLLDEETYRMHVPWKPSADLEDEVQALILRKVKERFRERRRIDPASLAGGKVSASDPEMDSPLGSNHSVTEDASIDQDDGSQESLDGDDEDTAMPSFLTDDDVATELLKPTVRHILSQFDDLLSGLHKNRQGYQRNGSPSWSQSRSKSRSRSRRSRSASKAANASAKGRAREREAASDSTTDSTESGDSDNETASQSKTRRQTRLNPRSWHEVITMASLVGWDEAVVRRAASRCASLFGESMPPMFESGAPKNADPSTMRQDRESLVVEERVTARYICPVENCPRKGEPFEKAWRWREHMKRTHKYSNDQIAEVEQSAKSEAMEPVRQTAERTQIRGGTEHPQLFTVKMGRGKDKRPRKRRTSKRRRVESSEEAAA